ncbi:MAG: type II toxin-antitoxin system VapC family toxin [Nitrospirae bacterium]|jgi:tRNA(fMet)-specific endonuclease VapC|nr:type II toxin-antitoxin system VapC family toxin [Nitrospirota bacterium]
MTLRYLIDTDWVIHYLNGHPSIVVRLNSLTEQGCALSVVSLAELYEGVYFSSNPTGNEQALDDFLRGASVLGIDAETCKIFGQHRGRLRAKGKMVGDFDLLIGATGLRHGLTVLTNNRRHFELIEGLPIESQ